jgi:hypothetical protein
MYTLQTHAAADNEERMLKAEVWASFGTGLVMTAGGLVFNATWLLALAAICYVVAFGLYLRQRRKGSAVAEKKVPLVGLDVNNSGGGVGMDIQSTGQQGAPSVGLDHIVHAQPGQDVVGMRVTQTGPGTGVRVVQNGPGTGMRVGIVIGDKKDGGKS